MMLTRIGVGGVAKTYGTISDKVEGATPRPGTLFTRIGVGGVGSHYVVLAKGEAPVVDEIVQHGGDSRRRKIYRTKEVYEALRIARLRVEEIPVIVGLDVEVIKLREIELKRAEKEVRERLQEQYGRVQGYPVPDKGLYEFVSGLRFDGELDISYKDMDQILLIILIDEWTDE